MPCRCRGCGVASLAERRNDLSRADSAARIPQSQCEQRNPDRSIRQRLKHSSERLAAHKRISIIPRKGCDEYGHLSPRTVAGLACVLSLAAAVGIGCQNPRAPVVQHPPAPSAPTESASEQHAVAHPAFEHVVDHEYSNGVLVQRDRGTDASVVIPVRLAARRS